MERERLVTEISTICAKNRCWVGSMMSDLCTSRLEIIKRIVLKGYELEDAIKISRFGESVLCII